MFNDMSRVTGALGLGLASVAYFPAMDVVRQALPMVMAVLKMALIISIPLVLTFATFDFKSVITVSIVMFAMIFVDFWFQLGQWFDTTILDAMYGTNSPHATLNPLLRMNNTQADMLLNYVMAAMFIILPTFWMSALSWAGFKAAACAGATTQERSPQISQASDTVEQRLEKLVSLKSRELIDEAEYTQRRKEILESI